MLKKVYVKLIQAKYYSKEEFQEKLDLLMSFGRLSADDYTELMLLLDQTYPKEDPKTVAEAPAETTKVEKPIPTV